MFEHYTLKNGVSVILVPVAGTASLTTLVMYPVGSRYESAKLSGVSHYIEHLMFKGTAKRKTSQILTREIDRLGAAYNAFTGKEYTGYYIKADATHGKIAMDILSDMLFFSAFDAKEMEREKTVICEEIKMYNDNPLMSIDNLFEEMFYAGCPMGRDIAGTEKTVLAYKREDVLRYRETYYMPKNMTVVVSGAVTEETKVLLEKYFGIDNKKKAPSKDFASAVVGSSKKEDRLLVQNRPTDQTQLMLGFPAYKFGDKRNAALGVLNTILGGSMSSRLFSEIREKRGLAYMVRSGSEQYRDTGYSFVRAGLDPKNVNKAIGVIEKELAKMAAKGATSRELNDAKTHIRGGFALALEDSSEMANHFARQALFADKIYTPEERLKQIDAVTNEEIIKVAKDVFRKGQMRIAVIGPHTKEDIKFEM